MTEEEELAARQAYLAKVDAAQAQLTTIIAEVDALQDVANATINANPAAYIKAVAERISTLANIQSKTIDFIFSHE